jgi:Ca-activated chloride channel family protein
MTRRIWTGACLLLGSLLGATGAHADQPITLDARFAQAVMKSGEKQTNYLRIGLQGCKPDPDRNRTPVNVSFVIDRSGSMAGERLQQARAAAIMAVNRLGPDDVASVVIFDDTPELLVAARPVSDPGAFVDQIVRIGPRGQTAIHSGVLVGAMEVRKFKDARRLNRIVLLSDGQANVGPRRPDEFAALGAALLADGISVSTIGLGAGYNEDLMLQLARASDGNHAFARDPSDLVAIFNREFNDALGACAQTVAIDIELKPGVRVVRAMSREGTIAPQHASFQMNQVYAATEHYVLMEVELDKELAGAGEQDLGIVKVGYALPDTQSRQTIHAPIRARFSSDEEEVRAGEDPKVTEAVLEQVTRARAQEAVKLRDEGNVVQARQLLMQNATEIKSYLGNAPAPSARMIDLQKNYEALGASAAPAASGQGLVERKLLRELEVRKAGSATRY